MKEREEVDMAEESISLYKRAPRLQLILGEDIDSSILFDDVAELINLTRIGIKTATLKPLAKHLGLTMEELSGILHSSYRNIQRKTSEDKLDSFKTEKVLALAMLANVGIESLGSKLAFKEWLHSDLIILGHSKPVDLLDTSFGINLLHDLLGRIAYGVYS